jgi:predicted DNA-binding protein
MKHLGTIAVQLPPAIRRQLARLSRQSGLPPAKIIRQAVLRELANLEKNNCAPDAPAARLRIKTKKLKAD